MTTPVTFLRLPLTSPCPVPCTPEGATMDADGEPLPMDERPELCAVDAGWLIGSQRVCDYHLRELFDQGFFEPGTFDDLCRDLCGHNADRVIEQSRVPWGERRRYTQEEAQSWAATAKASGLA